MNKNIKSKFPVFQKNPSLVFLDSAASALKVDEMINAVKDCYSYEYSNIHRGIYELSAKLTKKFEDSRTNISNFINSPSFENIVFTRNATEGINLISNSLNDKFIKDGDEIIISYLEHHANIVPWHLAKFNKNFKIIAAEINKKGEIDYDDLIKKINSKTKLIALTHMSNVTGSITNFERINDIRRKFNIPLLVDGCQFAAHNQVDIKNLDPDFYVFSAHKLYGPSGLGILYIKDKWFDIFNPYQGGGSMIEEVSINSSTYAKKNQKFEPGTPPIAQVIGLSASINFLKSFSMKKIYFYEKELYEYGIDKLNSINDFVIYGQTKSSGAIISFNIKGFHHNDIALLLDKKNIAVRSGHHCAMPLMKKLNVSGTVRASLGIYNSKTDIDYLVDSINEIKKFLQ